MKKIIFCFVIIVFSLANKPVTAQTTSPGLTKKQVNEWYQKKEWLSGLQWQPHSSVNKAVFARQYQINKTYWDKAFAFLKDSDLQIMAVGRHA